MQLRNGELLPLSSLGLRIPESTGIRQRTYRLRLCQRDCKLHVQFFLSGFNMGDDNEICKLCLTAVDVFDLEMVYFAHCFFPVRILFKLKENHLQWRLHGRNPRLSARKQYGVCRGVQVERPCGFASFVMLFKITLNQLTQHSVQCCEHVLRRPISHRL